MSQRKIAQSSVLKIPILPTLKSEKDIISLILFFHNVVFVGVTSLVVFIKYYIYTLQRRELMHVGTLY